MVGVLPHLSLCVHLYLLLLELEAESAASLPVLLIPLHVQTDNMAASRLVVNLLAGGVIFVKVDLSRHHDTSTNAPKVLDCWGGPGACSLGETCNCRPQESTFPAFYRPGF